MHFRWWIVDSVILVLLLTISSIWFLWHHAYGAFGDDSPGYIYLAEQIASGEALVQQDPLVQQALAYFGTEPYARFVAPAHHEIISPAGWTASRYPIGLSVLMAVAILVTGKTVGMYLVVPILAVGVVLLTYWLAVRLLPVLPAWKRVLGIGSAVIVLNAEVFANYAVAQPMREIPSIFFFLIAVWLFTYKKPLHLALAGLSFAYSVGIRETGAILVIPLVIYGWKTIPKQRWQAVLAFGIGAVLGYSIFFAQIINISSHKEVFRDKDITSIALTSNIDHIQSLAIHNLWDNQGKFRPGVGGLEQYWQVLNDFSPWPFFILCLVLGAIGLWRTDRKLFWLLVSWFTVIILLFGMWINPYPRYILPVLPVAAWLAMFGLYTLWQWLTTSLQLQRWLSLALLLIVCGTLIVAYQPTYARQQERLLTGEPVSRELTLADLDTVLAVVDSIQADAMQSNQPPLLLMMGSTKGGLAETIMAHSDLRVIRFPTKAKEQPPLDDFDAFMKELQQTYTVYVWYDPSISVLEQRFYNQQVLALVTTGNLSFRSTISLYRVVE